MFINSVLAYVHVPHIYCLIISLNWYFVNWGSKRSRVFYTHFEHSIGIKAGTLVRYLTLFEMDRSQSLNAPPYFDGSNYAFWKVQMRAFLCSIDEFVCDSAGLSRRQPNPHEIR